MTAELDTRSSQPYVPEGDFLPDADAATSEPGGFARSRERFDAAVGWLVGEEAGAFTDAELEARLEADARELFRQLLQDHLDLRAC